MKKEWLICLVIALALHLCACMDADSQVNEETRQPTAESTTESVTTTQAVELNTAPAHSLLSLPDHTPDQMWEYFEEVVFHAEYSDGIGDASLVQKWVTPMYYYIDGDPTDEDLTVLRSLFEQLNEIDGFPGIYAADTYENANLFISFLDSDAFFEDFSGCINGENAYGAAWFEYNTDTNEIHTANVGYRTDLDQVTRNSTLLEEIVNMLGITDTVHREDSIVYQYSDDNLALSDVDWVILKLLYSSEISCGMNADSCRPIVGALYD